jgi:hypothetical protein
MTSSLLSYSFTKFMTCNYAYRHIINAYSRDILGVHHVSIRSLKENTKIFDKDEYELQKDIHDVSEYSAKVKTFKNKKLLNYCEYNDNANTLMALNVNEYNVHKMVIPTIYYWYYTGYEDNQCIKINNMIDVLQEEGRFGEIYSYSDYKYVYDRNKFLAWTMLFGKNIHHVALETNNIYHLTNKLIKDGYVFNHTSKCDNVFNVSVKDNIIQSSLVELKTIYKFKDGSRKIPFTYIELIEKYTPPLIK